MAEKKTTQKTGQSKNKLEERKVEALEKIANGINDLSIWFEEIDKEEWGERIEFYLFEWFKNKIKVFDNTENDEERE